MSGKDDPSIGLIIIKNVLKPHVSQEEVKLSTKVCFRRSLRSFLFEAG